MELIYRAYDGKEFKTAEECIKHEKVIREGVKMWNPQGYRTKDVSMAVVISIKDEDSMLAFHKMCYDYAKEAHTGEEGARRLIGGLESDISGYFMWDEGREEYRWLDEDLILPIVSLAREEGFV